MDWMLKIMVLSNRSPKGFMEYTFGRCSSCANLFIGRFRIERKVTWERCPTQGCVDGFPMVQASWDDYVDWMENGAQILYDE